MEKLDPSFGRNGRLAELFFGTVKGSECKEAHKTRAAFSESRITGGRSVIYTRNAIDRFSGGTINGALYTEKTYFDGETTLEIRCDLTGIEESDVKHFMQVLTAAILDLHRGYLAVGGLTSVGHGMFLVKSVRTARSQIDFAGQDTGALYQKLLNALI